MDAGTVDVNFLFSNFEEQPLSKSKSKKSRKRKFSDGIVGEDGVPVVDLSDEISRVIEQKDKYIQQLEEQNNKLKAVIKRICGPQSFAEKHNLWERGSRETMPMAMVLYVNNEFSIARRRDVEETMVTMIQDGNDLDRKLVTTQDLKAQPSAVPLRAFASDTKGKRLHIAKNVTTSAVEPHIYSAVHYYLEFCIDRTGLPLLEHNPGITEIWTIPVYDQVFLNALPLIDDDGKKVFVRQKRSKHCFNCLGDHNVSQCDQPRDIGRINANRQEFLNKFGGSPSNESRYHQGEEDRFKDFKAGIISENLRKALSIGIEDLPPYIYKMRRLGYPPGYLSSGTGLLMYGKEGQIQDSYDGEEGEIQSDNLKDRIQYPGFNAPLGHGVIDRSVDYGLPLFEDWRNTEQSRSNTEHSISKYSDPRQQQDRFNISAERIHYGNKTTFDDMEIEDTHSTFEQQHKFIEFSPNAEKQHQSFESPRNGMQFNQGTPPPLPDYTPERPPPPPQHGLTPPPLPNYTPEQAPPPPDHDPSDCFGESPLTAVEIGEILEKAEMRAKQASIIDSFLAQEQSTSLQAEDASCREWWSHEPLSNTTGVLYFTCTPPPSLKVELSISDILQYSIADIDREPWKTDSTSWYDPLYGDLAAPTGIYDSIKEILKKRKRKGRKNISKF